MRIISFILLLNITCIAFASDNKTSNQLINESSPYLLQHAYNPVNWYPWGAAAFTKARQQNKPLFISIGYSTCHWCHVMAHESFENNKIAKLLNDNFISIKVDREERPDIDRIYLTASEVLAGYGGWPTTIIATTELKPFFATTYLPPFAADGRKGLEDILNSATALWHEDRQKINTVADEVTEILRTQLQSKVTKGKVSASSLEKTYRQFVSSFDTEHGGFGHAPKFPRTSVFDFLLLYDKHNPSGKAKAMVINTLDTMLRAGIYDQVGGGFHRYAVDAQWKVPHFEKMLYDQGLIINTLLDASQATDSQRYHAAITQSLDFVLERMRSDNGGFYSAYDADSIRPDNPEEHGEGAYYVWNKAELDRLLSTAEKKVFYEHFNIQKKGNVDSDPQNEFLKLNILHAEYSLQRTANDLSLKLSEAKTLLASSMTKLKQQRSKRPLPHLDDKIITSWNALMLKALTKAASQLKRDDYQAAAEKAARFIHRQLYNPVSKQLYRSVRNGKQSGEAYLDDYAYLINALLSLYQSSNDRQWLIWANELMDQQISVFYDRSHHGFFDNSGNDKNILFRSKHLYDGSLPSANAVSVENLILLSRLIKRPDWITMASNSLHSFHSELNDLFGNHPQMFRSLLLLNE
ncbi:MAG: thioredoxin domain-containing protein [Gammaproteobacteria bacterium]|nr:thioredoxin domain-containing protein [Gammaproteobacteria bacterium]